MEHKKKSRFRPGFTLIELVIVVAIIAVLLLIATPATMRILPRYELRVVAKTAQSLLQQARQKANHTNRPVRVVFDCRVHLTNSSVPCQVFMDTAIFDKTGALDGWSSKVVGTDGKGLPIRQGVVIGTVRELSSKVNIVAGISNEPISVNQVRTVAKPELGVAGLFWVVYLPDGRMKTSQDTKTWLLVFTLGKTDQPGEPKGDFWVLWPSAETGSINLLSKGS